MKITLAELLSTLNPYQTVVITFKHDEHFELETVAKYVPDRYLGRKIVSAWKVTETKEDVVLFVVLEGVYIR